MLIGLAIDLPSIWKSSESRAVMVAVHRLIPDCPVIAGLSP